MPTTKASSVTMSKRPTLTPTATAPANHVEPLGTARAVITKRLEELGWSRNRLAEQCQRRARIGKTNIYSFLDGKSSLNSDSLDFVLDILGIEYRVGGPAKPVE